MEPIDSILVQCARPCDAARPIDPALFRDGNINWGELIRRAEYHGLVPLLHAHMKASLSSDIAHTDWFLKIERAALANAARNAFLAGKLRELISTLTDLGIRALPLKGPVLAVQAYNDVSMRAFDDLDLLVRESDIIPAANALRQLGYQPKLELTDTETKAHVKAGWGYTLRSPDSGYFVELDSNIGSDFFSIPISFDRLWANRDKVTLDGASFETVAMTDLVPLLCAHGTKHLWRRLRWLADLAAIQRNRNDIKWNTVLERATSLGCRRMVLAGFALCRSITGMSMPPELEQALAKDTSALELSRGFEAGIFESGGRSGKAGHLRAMRLRWYARERWQDRIVGALRQLFTPGYSDWKWVRLPPALFPLYWLLRPVRLACGCARVYIAT